MTTIKLHDKVTLYYRSGNIIIMYENSDYIDVFPNVTLVETDDIHRSILEHRGGNVFVWNAIPLDKSTPKCKYMFNHNKTSVVIAATANGYTLQEFANNCVTLFNTVIVGNKIMVDRIEAVFYGGNFYLLWTKKKKEIQFIFGTEVLQCKYSLIVKLQTFEIRPHKTNDSFKIEYIDKDEVPGFILVTPEHIYVGNKEFDRHGNEK